MTRWTTLAVGTLALTAPTFVLANPIAFADGTTVMVEYGAGTMEEAQILYASRYNFSIGSGHIEFDSDETPATQRITYARLNYLVHRWNLESAQANIFAWGGAGSATGNAFRGAELAGAGGAQADYETLRVTRPSRPTGSAPPRSRTEWTRCSSESPPTGTSTTGSRHSSSSRDVTTRAASIGERSGRRCCGCSRVARGSRPG